jgi:hypothetical protein
MSDPNILQQLRAAGITLTLAGDKLKYTSENPPTAEYLELMKQHKPALIEVLKAEATPPSPEIISVRQRIFNELRRGCDFPKEQPTRRMTLAELAEAVGETELTTALAVGGLEKSGCLVIEGTGADEIIGYGYLEFWAKPSKPKA